MRNAILLDKRTPTASNIALAIAGRDEHFISFLFAIGQQFRAKNFLLSYES